MKMAAWLPFKNEKLELFKTLSSKYYSRCPSEEKVSFYLKLDDLTEEINSNREIKDFIWKTIGDKNLAIKHTSLSHLEINHYKWIKSLPSQGGKD